MSEPIRGRSNDVIDLIIFLHPLCYICKITIAIFNLVKAGLLYLINYIIMYLCIVSSYKEEPCDEAAHW